MKRILIWSVLYVIAAVSLLIGSAMFFCVTEDQALFFIVSSVCLYIIVFIILLCKNHMTLCLRIHRIKHSAMYLITGILIIGGLFTVIHIQRNSKQNNQIPESLVKFAEKYPESSGFVSNFPKRKGESSHIDLSHDVTSKSIPLFIQWDERWGYETYGDDYLAITGCGPTCISMIACSLTGDLSLNPYAVAKFSEEKGYYVSGEGTSWELMTTGAAMLGLQASQGTVSKEYIVSNLSDSSPMICSMYPGDFTYTGHFIVLAGIDNDGKIIVNDPNSKLNSKKHWSLNDLLPQIRNIWIYTAKGSD